MNSTGARLAPIYEDPDATRRSRSFIRRIFIALLAVALLTSTAGMVASQRALDAQHTNAVAQQLDADLVHAGLLSSVPAELLGEFGAAAELDVMRVDGDGSVESLAAGAGTDTGAWQLWRARLRLRARGDERTFFSVSPDGSEWSHHRIAPTNGSLLIVSRQVPRPDPTIPLGPIAAGSLAVMWLALGAAWIVFEVRFSRSTALLLEAAGDLRLRGDIRPEVRSAMDRIPKAPSELARLGAVLTGVEQDAHHRLRQTEELLLAASTLGSSLDPETVLAAALEPLQRLLHSHRSAILRYDQRRHRFQVVTARGHTEKWLHDLGSASANDAQASIRSIREGVPVQISDTESEVVPKGLRDRARAYGYRSVLAVPLALDVDHPITLVVQCAEPRSYSFDEIELCKSFGAIASAALRNAELFSQTDAQLRQQTDRLEAIVESVEQGLLVAGSEGQLVYANATMRALLPSVVVEGMSADAYIESVLAGPGVSPSAASDLVALSAGPSTWLDLDVPDPATGDLRSFRIRKFVVRDAHGDAIGRGQTWTDVSSERELALMKSGLLAAVSHEFRTPLALIKGYATTLLADDVDWDMDDRREFLQLVSSEADRLSELVQRILDMRRIDAGMVPLQVMPVDLAVVVDAACAASVQLGDRIVVHTLPDQLVEVDAARITTVLRNLVENACKYSPSNARVEISAHTNDDSVVFSVRDHGPGIDNATSLRLFETFVRGQSGLAAETSGVGLGLAISKGFVEAHGGRIWIETPDGGGARFCFAIPLVQPEPELVGAR